MPDVNLHDVNESKAGTTAKANFIRVNILTCSTSLLLNQSLKKKYEFCLTCYTSFTPINDENVICTFIHLVGEKNPCKVTLRER